MFKYNAQVQRWPLSQHPLEWTTKLSNCQAIETQTTNEASYKSRKNSIVYYLPIFSLDARNVMIFSFRDFVSLFKCTEELPGAPRGAEEATPITSGSAILKIYCAALPNRVEASSNALSSRHRGCPPLFLHPCGRWKCVEVTLTFGRIWSFWPLEKRMKKSNQRPCELQRATTMIIDRRLETLASSSPINNSRWQSDGK